MKKINKKINKNFPKRKQKIKRRKIKKKRKNYQKNSKKKFQKKIGPDLTRPSPGWPQPTFHRLRTFLQKNLFWDLSFPKNLV